MLAKLIFAQKVVVFILMHSHLQLLTSLDGLEYHHLAAVIVLLNHLIHQMVMLALMQLSVLSHMD